MAITATLLSSLLCTKADINYYVNQEMFINAKYEANLAKLNKQIKYHEKWETAFDSAMDNDKAITAGNVKVEAGNNNEAVADAYAHAKVEEYDEELSLELADKDMEYDSIKCTIEALLEELRAKEEAEKTATSSAAKDTGLLNAG